MFKNKRLLVICMTIVILVVIGGLFYKNKDELYINRILSSKNYSYLPEEAKEYIKDVYKESGEVILTEKNKKYNKPYLNPIYEKYLSKSEEEKKEMEIVPTPYKVDYIENNFIGSEELPNSFDLRNVNNDVYITPLKNQKSTGLCWAFSMAEHMESYLMMKSERPYDALTTKLISPRQIDYATSTNGIKNYENEFGNRELLEGGNFIISSEIASYGLSMVEENRFPFNESSEQKELYEVLNFSDLNYEVNNTIEIPIISRTMLLDDRCSAAEDYDECYDEYYDELKNDNLYQIKYHIYNYGGGEVETISPQSACGFTNEDGNNVLDVYGYCYDENLGHGMQLIGWDDNYDYSYCKVGKTNVALNNGNCSVGKKVTGKGAFILRNSWGESDFAYIYLTYESFNDENTAPAANFVVDATEMSTKEWDNLYKSELNNLERVIVSTKSSKTFVKTNNDQEKLEKIKFRTVTNDGNFAIKIKNGNNTYYYSSIISTTYPGLYTIDLSSKNIVLDGNEFSVEIQGTAYTMNESISAFTSNVSKIPTIETDEITVTENDVIVLSKTKNIDSNEEVEYKLFNGDKDITEYLTINNNFVAHNFINTEIEIIEGLPNGSYVLKTIYDNNSYETPFTVNIDGNNSLFVYFYSNYSDNEENIQVLSAGTETLLDSDLFTREGYTFKEWNTEIDGSGISYSSMEEIEIESAENGVLTLYAQWEPITYKIVFNSNNGEGVMTNQELTYGVQDNINKNTFTKEGHIFKEWNTKIDGTGTSYSDEQSVINLSSTENDSITLYAQWQEPTVCTINNYEVDGTNNYISKIMVNTEVNNFTSNITLGNGYGIDVDTKTINDKQVLYTGGKTRITHGLDLYKEYTNVVIGDINGDGAINSADLLKIRQHLLGANTLTGAYFLSSDINYDYTINSADLLRVRQHLLGTKTIE